MFFLGPLNLESSFQKAICSGFFGALKQSILDELVMEGLNTGKDIVEGMIPMS